jgi:hypothetical protein
VGEFGQERKAEEEDINGERKDGKGNYYKEFIICSIYGSGDDT